ncbi:MAG: hypothetical protein HY951_12150 [Bacteroidia bacterium]|nr:hypothetical protein [Bacteroidia bacterium]
MKNLIIVLSMLAMALYGCNSEVKTVEMIGGIRINLEVDNIDLLKKMCVNPEDSIFNLCLQKTSSGQYNSLDEFLDVFNKTIQETDPTIQLASYFASIELKDKISFTTTNEQVIAVLKSELQKRIEQTVTNVTKRLEKFSDQTANVKQLEYNLILVEVPGLFQKERISNLLQSTGSLGFWETYDNSEVYQYIDAANKKIFELGLGIEKPIIEEEKNDNSLLDEIKSSSDSVNKKFSAENPLLSILFLNIDNQQKLIPGAVVGLADAKDTAQVNKYLELRQIKLLFPSNIRFMWSLKPYNNSTVYQLIGIRVSNRDGRAPLDGSVITSAKTEMGYSGSPEVTMKMNSEGAKIWSRLTRDNVGKQIAIVLDNYVYSFPIVNQEIKGGNSSISGNFTKEEADDLVSILNAGSSPVKLKVIAVDIKEAVKK